MQLTIADGGGRVRGGNQKTNTFVKKNSTQGLQKFWNFFYSYFKRENRYFGHIFTNLTYFGHPLLFNKFFDSHSVHESQKFHNFCLIQCFPRAFQCHLIQPHYLFQRHVPHNEFSFKYWLLESQFSLLHITEMAF